MLNIKEISKIKNDLAMISYNHKQFSGIIDNTLKYIGQLESIIEHENSKEIKK